MQISFYAHVTHLLGILKFVLVATRWMETSVDHSIRNDWKNKHFPATPCFKLAYKSVNETIFLLSIITRYHWLALALPQFAELNRSSGPRLIGPFTTKSRFYRFSKRTGTSFWNFSRFPSWKMSCLHFLILFYFFFFLSYSERFSRIFYSTSKCWDVF